MQKYLEIFNTVKLERAAGLEWQHKLLLKTGEGLGAAVLKIMKPAWSTDAPEDLLNTNGLFFSIWVDAACEAKGVARYNLHAKKLRALKGETFAAREFARSFRAAAKSDLAAWPNCTFPVGPITLFEGHLPLDETTLQAETNKLVDRFVKLTPLIEQRLAA
jgi:hypothetical protein